MLYDLVADATKQLREAGVENALRDARILLARAAQIDSSRLPLICDTPLCPDIQQYFLELIELRAKRIPVSHLLGEREFYGRRFEVSGKVLDPRPETETLIDAALSRPFRRVLDLGIGSGAILVTLLAECPEIIGVGVDICPYACRQSVRNAAIHQVSDRIEIIQSDWFEHINGQFDLIVSNPPYIAAEEMNDLSDEVRLYEPVIALTDGADGLTFYRKICGSIHNYLNPGGRVIFEINPTKSAQVYDVALTAGFGQISVIKDLDQRERIVVLEYT